MHSNRKNELTKLYEASTHIFDFDGVIADTARIKFEAFEQTLDSLYSDFRRSYGNALRSELIGVGRSKVAGWVESHVKDAFLSKDWLNKFADFLENRVLDVQAIPGAHEYIRRLSQSGKLNLIVSSAPRADILEALTKLEIPTDLFMFVHGVEAGSKTEVVDALIREKKLVPAECFFYGDMPSDARAAQNLGVRFIRIRSEPGRQMDFNGFPQPFFEIDDFNQWNEFFS
ncbi:MAG: hypothetical protein EOP04_25815 [Proteobacteria bacterium]|nr:MAG: hypothetical protein EOP04_25815 [Pseudomonadota bacterium]